MKKRFLVTTLTVAMISASMVFNATAGDVAATEEPAIVTEAGDSGESTGDEAAAAGESTGDSADMGESDGESSGESDGESSGDAAGGPVLANGSNNEDTSIVVVMNNEEPQINETYGTLEMAEGGIITGTNISGIKLKGSTDESNGFYFKTDDDNAFFTLGGAEDYYEVEGLGSFNSVIEVYGTETDMEVECDRGTAVTVSGGNLVIDNVYLHTEGYRSGTLYSMSADHLANVIIKDSTLWTDGAEGSFMPDFKLIVGSARNTLLLGNDVWLYNSNFVSKDWGAISHDMKMVRTEMYAVNIQAETYAGGYTLYALDCTDNYIYGSRMVSPEFGMFAMGHGLVYLDNIAAADETALQYAEGEDFTETVTEDGNSLLAGGVNAIVLHTMASANQPADITIKNTTVSTMEEDVVSALGLDLDFDLDSYLTNPARYGEAWFYLANLKGAVITTRSHAGNINIEEGTVIKSESGVLVQTSLEFDTQAGDVWHDSDDNDPMYDIYMNLNTAVEGDILHQDYMRDFYVNVNAEYTGKVVTGSITAYNNLWSKEGLAALLEKYGMTDKFDLSDEAVANIRSILVREEDTAAYTDVLGVKLTVAEGATWNVSGESSVLSLTIAEGATVNAAEMYVDCAFGADGYLDSTTGTKVDIAAGEYTNVVLK